MIVAFFVCITPKTIAQLYYHYNFEHLHANKDDAEFFINVNVLFKMLQLSNCSLNPLIYGKLHESFRSRLRLCFSACCNFRELVREKTCNISTNIPPQSSVVSMLSFSRKGTSLDGLSTNDISIVERQGKTESQWRMNMTCLRRKCGISQSRSVFFPQYGIRVFRVLLDREDQLHAQG